MTRLMPGFAVNQAFTAGNRMSALDLYKRKS